MAEDQSQSDWLATLSGEQPEESGPVLQDLRDQILQADDEFGEVERPAATNFLAALEPWQRLVLSLMLFLDVALCGCMALVATGRVRLPF
jgi:hypothetical protein